MVYGVGIIGFVLGFIVGQWLLLKLLKDVPKKDLVEDKTIRWKYGVFNWMIAALGAYVLVSAYRIVFG